MHAPDYGDRADREFGAEGRAIDAPLRTDVSRSVAGIR